MDSSNPLVSVFIVTYNSQDYIVDALNSTKAQTYQNVELVVSDDCSSDNTVEIVKEWIKQNGRRFIRTTLVETPFNTGTSANYNRAVRACQGVWLKMLDGDDMISPSCIEDNLKYIESNPRAQVVFSNFKSFKGDYPENVQRGEMSHKADLFFSLPQIEQRRFLLRGNILPSQTCFVKADLLKANPYNENYRLLEDYPMWLHLLEIGIPFYYFDKTTAYYRQEDSVSSNHKELFPRVYTEIYKEFVTKDVMALICKYKDEQAYDYHRKYLIWYDFCSRFLGNKKNHITTLFYWISKFIIFKSLRFRL